MTPVRQTKFVAEHGTGNCQTAAMASMLDLPFEEVVDMADPEVRKRGFWPEVYRWLNDRGLKMKRVYGHMGLDILKGVYSIGVGPSPRGQFLHCVVCKNGVMVWDPHPSDDGIVGEFEYHDLIIPMTDAERLSHEFRKRANDEHGAP